LDQRQPADNCRPSAIRVATSVSFCLAIKQGAISASPPGGGHRSRNRELLLDARRMDPQRSALSTIHRAPVGRPGSLAAHSGVMSAVNGPTPSQPPRLERKSLPSSDNWRCPN
jgi:hypothetical protein